MADSVDEAKAAARPLGLARRARSGEAPGPGTAGFDRAKRSRGGATCWKTLPDGPSPWAGFPARMPGKLKGSAWIGQRPGGLTSGAPRGLAGHVRTTDWPCELDQENAANNHLAEIWMDPSRERR